MWIRDAVRRRLPREDTTYIADSANCPYGNRPAEEIVDLSRRLVERLAGMGCKMVVIACNTATAAAAEVLREEWKDLPIVGIEPAVKPAAMRSRSGVVGVLATRGTFGGRLYRGTCEQYAKGVKVVTAVADEFVELVERGVVEGEEAERAVRARLEPLLAAGADHIVLGCTHFPHLLGVMERVAGGRAELVEPSEAVARQVERRLGGLGLLNLAGGERHIVLV